MAMDDLVRLKQIFNTTLDDLLREEADAEKEYAKEHYRFALTPKELAAVTKALGRYVGLRYLFLIVAIAFGTLQLCLADYTTGAFFWISAIVYMLIQKDILFGYRKQLKNDEEEILRRVYDYEVYSQHVIVRVLENDRQISEYRIPYDSIANIRDYGVCQSFVYEKNRFFLCSNVLCTESLFRAPFDAAVEEETEKRWHRRTLLSIWAAVLTPVLVWGCQLALELVFMYDWPDMFLYWVPLCYLPIPLAVIAWGIYLKVKGRDWKKIVILGISVAVIVCIWSSVWMSVEYRLSGYYEENNEDTSQEDEQYVRKIEDYLGMDIPEWNLLSVDFYDDGPRLAGRNQIYVNCHIWLDSMDMEGFDEYIRGDERWQENVSNELLGIQPGFCEWSPGEYALFYNMDLNEFNQVPPESGTYRFVYALYESERDQLIIIEYDLVYVK